MFFADKVVLVEGLSDRIFFDAVFRRLGVQEGSIRTCEIIDVGGKGFFALYENLLKACQVRYAIIADLDYVSEVGTDAIKALFAVSPDKIVDDVINNPSSKDGSSLVARMGDAIDSGDMEDLTKLWQYIKSRRRRLRNDLIGAEKQSLDNFVEAQRSKNILILSKGDLETYLPIGYKSKDIDKLIKLIDIDFWALLDKDAQDEITLIANHIKSL